MKSLAQILVEAFIKEYIFSDDISEGAKENAAEYVRRAFVKSRFNSKELFDEVLTYEQCENDCADTDFLIQCTTDEKHELYALAIEILHEELGD